MQFCKLIFKRPFCIGLKFNGAHAISCALNTLVATEEKCAEASVALGNRIGFRAPAHIYSDLKNDKYQY